LPARLAEIQVDLAARLGASDVPLAELLGLEAGDVIPLSTPADRPLRIYVEDRLRARAVLGQKDGRLAVRIVEIGPEDEDA
jgi:flagellar motor switch protein FliM